ncbi:MAG TPA: hydrogenase formation protein HypD [Granulicella sp.]|jgi:hydrogenase expression/formation protein HypD|nr:hydrogenase formation protein HypD [Granulicella sp.]
MKYLDEYRNGEIAAKIIAEMRRVQTRQWVLMEVCGGQTHSIVKNGLDHLLPEGVELVHGPGCPVCVTPLEMIDKAHAIARLPNVIFCSFGDMLRVPGSDGDLFSIKSLGGDVRIVYSPLDCLRIARANPDKQVVFFAIGFETTAPANAMLAWRAREEHVNNLSLLVSHVLVPPALEAILSASGNRVQGFLGPGHVCAVMGYSEYDPISGRYHVPIVITGFEPIDILQGVLMTIQQLEEGRATVENQYSRILDRQGNQPAQRLISQVFEVGDRQWRGIGTIPNSGYHLRDEFSLHDAEKLFDVAEIATLEPEICISGEILRGLKKPHDCPAFGTICDPQHPLGATMVSAEGACAAYYAYGRHLNPEGTDKLHQILPTPAPQGVTVQSH